jgi:3-methyladenine DNA glycosylase AlkC
MSQGYSLKDQLFNAQKVGYLAGLFAQADPTFDAQSFETRVMARLLDLELKARIAWIAEVLGETFPGPLPQIAPKVLAALPEPLDPTLTDDDFGDFIFAPVGEFVVARGATDHPDLVLDLLEELTQRFSMEWPIRPMLNLWPDLVLTRMEVWLTHPSYHVRRLVSEGTRPKLPWGEGVGLDVARPLPLLDHLHADGTRFVTRSVANHLNDISKSDPDLGLDRLQGWAAQGRQTTAELDWLTRHALRGLIKAGHSRALCLLGYDPDIPVTVDLSLGEPVHIGEALAFDLTLRSDCDLPVLVDYVLHFQRPSGRVSRKVFKLKQAQVTAGTPLVLSKQHKLKANASTFDLIPGAHRIEVQVNGKIRAQGVFDLLSVR